MKILMSIALCAAMTIGVAGAESVSDAIETYATPPQISADEVLSGNGSVTELGYKIHGKNGGDKKFKCQSFGSDLGSDIQQKAVLHGVLSSYAYLDNQPGYTYSKDGVTTTQKRKDCLENTDYEALSAEKLNDLIANTSMKVSNDGNRVIGKSESETDQSKTRFDATVLVKKDKNGNVSEVVISYRGTEFSNEKDWSDDFKQALNAKGKDGLPEQYLQSSELLKAVLTNPEYRDAKIVCDGHSLGGGLVTYAMADNDLQGRVTGYTYNAAGLSKSTLESIGNVEQIKDAAHNITNIRAQWDPVSYVGYHLGDMYETASPLKDATKNHGLIFLLDSMMPYGTNPKQSESVENVDKMEAGDNSDVTGNATTPVVQSTQDSDADMTGSTLPSAESSLERLAEQLLKEYQNGESNVLPDDFFNDVFKNTLGEPKKTTDIAQTAYDDKISTLIEDKTVAQKVKDFVKGEIDKVVAKGEEWVENGGIRDAIKKGLDKILDGKVSDAQMQEILNLTDGLCNVNKDGGTSLIAALKTDGKDLAVSLAINELEKQLSNALPEDVADTLNSMLDVIADKGTAKDVRDSLLLEAQKLVSKYVPYDNSVKTINGVLQDIIDGNAIDAMDTVKGLGVSVGADALKDVLSKNLPPEVADRINGLLDGFAQNGAQGLTDAAKNEIYGLIDQYAPGGDSAKQLKNVIDGVISGSVTGNDLKDAATSIVGDGAKGLINNSNLPQDVKNAANAAIDGLMQNGLTGLTTNARDFISDYVADYLGDAAAGDAVGKIFDAVVTPGVDPWQEIVNQAPVIGAAIGHKVVAEVEKFAAAQIDKLIAKCPALQKVLNKLGINGAGIINGVKNVFSVLKNAPDLQTALTKLGDMAVNFLKDIAGKLIDWALEWAISWINNNIIPKVVDWASETLAKMAGSTNNELLQKGLAWLSDQVKNCKKCAAIKIKVDGTGAKIVDKVDQWIKSKQSTTTTVLQTNGGKK